MRPFEAGVWFQVACSQLAAFVGLKHSEALGFLKQQCHFLCVSVRECFFFFFVCLMLITSHFIDEMLMSSSHTDCGSFCVIKI